MALGIFDIVFKVTGAGDAVQALRNIKSEAKQTADTFDQTKQSSDALGKQFQGLLAGAAIAGFAKSAIDAAVQFDSMQRSLATTVGSTDELNAQMERLRKVALSPGIDLKQTIDGFTRLRSTGKFSAKEAEDGLAGIANAVASVGAPAATVERVVTAISQIAGGLQVNQEELNQLREALPSFGVLMERAFGTANAEQINKMGISAEKAAKKLLTSFSEGPKAAAGLQTALDNINDTYVNMQVSIGNLLATMLMAFGPTVTSAMESVTNAVKEISKQGTILNTVFKAFIAFGLAALVVDLALKFGVFVDAVIKAIAAVRALGMTALIAKAFVSPEAAIASAVAAAGLAVGAALIFDQIMKGIKPIEVQATGGTAAGKAGNLLPPAMKDIGGAADTAAKAGKSTEGKGGGGLIGTMVAIAEYAARMQAAFVDMAKSMEGHLFEIAKNTGSTRDLLDLRKQTFGGGRLGAIGVTAAEIQSAGNNATNQGGVGIIPQTLIPASTDLERSMRKMMIQYGRQQLVTEMRRI
jgi:tape measure domain-containing protein